MPHDHISKVIEEQRQMAQRVLNPVTEGDHPRPGHEITAVIDTETMKLYKCQRPGTWEYGFFVAFMPLAIAVYGDTPDRLFRLYPARTGYGALEWLKNAAGSPSYLLEKLAHATDHSSGNRGYFYPDAVKEAVREALKRPCAFIIEPGENDDHDGTECGQEGDALVHCLEDDHRTHDNDGRPAHRYCEPDNYDGLPYPVAFAIDDEWHDEDPHALGSIVMENTEGDFEILEQFYSYGPGDWFVAAQLRWFVEKLATMEAANAPA